MPAYNRAHLIEQALQSVADQTYRPIELLVVDDGSTDQTADVTREWAARAGDRALDVQILKQANAGNAAAKNTGLRAASGAFIQILDTDDLMFPDKLTVEVAALKRSGRDYAYSRTRVAHPDGRRTETPHPDSFKPAPIGRFTMYQEAILLTRRAFETIGLFDATLTRGSDRVMMTRLKASALIGVFVDATHTEHSLHPGARMSQVKDTILSGGTQSPAEYRRLAASREVINERILEILLENKHYTPDERRFLARAWLFCADTYAAGGDPVGTRRCIQRAWQVASGRAAILTGLVAVAGRVLGDRRGLAAARRLVATVKPRGPRFSG